MKWLPLVSMFSALRVLSDMLCVVDGSVLAKIYDIINFFGENVLILFI